MDLATAVDLLSRGTYCLWVGAGASIHLGGGDRSLGWASLTEALEARAGVIKPDDTWNASLPERLDVCLRALGRDRFQAALREQVCKKLSGNIVEAAVRYTIDGIVPTNVVQLARLGALANPIVNFNIETFSSWALGFPNGPCRVQCFRPPTPEGRMHSSGSSNENQRRFARSVYHPHGAITHSGLCVMTSSDYRNLGGTLALELATHAAFESRLAIVGMSLDDEYLRDQLASFRNQVHQILWFTSDEPRPDVARWAWVHDVECVRSSWPDFWQAIDTKLPEPEMDAMQFVWHTIGWMAFSESEGRSAMAHHIKVFLDMGSTETQIASFRRQAALMGESEGTGDYFAVSPDSIAFTKKYLSSLLKK